MEMIPLMFYLAIAIFIGTYVGIMTEKIPRVLVALIGGGLMVYCGFLNQDEAVKEFIDFNTIGLLTGMMVIVAVVKKSGFFEAMAIWAMKITKGRPKKLLILFAIITAIGASVLDSVTAVLLLAPMTISLCHEFHESPYPFLITEILMANIGGTALMVGNPPNIMIGSATHLDFNDFALNLGPGVVLTMIVIVGVLIWVYRDDLHDNPLEESVLQNLHEESAIKDKVLMKRSLIILGLTILGFILHGPLGLQSATIALTGATLVMIFCEVPPHDAFCSVDWETLFFFVGLFTLVGGFEKAGVISALANWAVTLVSGNSELMTFFILWLSAIASAFIDNIPFTATMIPLIKDMQQMMGLAHADYMWWSLAMGACFGGNGTIIGASPNIIVTALIAKEGMNVTFMGFMKKCFPIMILSVAVAHLYLYVRYFLL